MPNQIEPAAEFQKLPLDLVIGSSLTAVAKAQAIAAQTTVDFVKALCTPDPAGNGVLQPQTMQLSIERESPADGAPAAGAGGGPVPAPVPAPAPVVQRATIKAPLLAMVPIPHLIVDSVTINFKYEVAQTFLDKSTTSEGAQLDVATTGFLSNFVKANLQGNIAHTSASEASTNRGGTLDIMIRASQSPIPVGLERLITMLSQSITPK